MASFDYSTYAATVAAAQNKDKNAGVKVGFFKLADGGEALVRFNVSKVDDLAFASIHRVKRNPEDRWASMAVSCLKPVGYGSFDVECPLCEAVANGDDRVQKVGKRVFVQLMVAYKDANGVWSKPEPVIWERPAGFYKEIMAKLNNFGDLKKQLFKITRDGAGLDTKYTIDYAVPAVFKPELVPEDFSAFENFNIAKHSYWEKTADECRVYLETGNWPDSKGEIAAEPAKAEATKAAAPVAEKPVEAKSDVSTMSDAEVVAPVSKPAATKTTTDFGDFSF